MSTPVSRQCDLRRNRASRWDRSSVGPHLRLVIGGVGLLVAALALIAPWPVFADQLNVRGSVRAGAEVDDNTFRTETDPVSDILARYFMSLSVLSPVGGDGRVNVDVKHGGKFFAEQADADTLLTQLSLAYQHGVFDALGFYASADLKDRTERLSVRDYTRGGAGAGVDVFVGDFSLRLGGALRYFAFKPNPESSSSNVEGLAHLRWDISSAFDASAGYTYATRAFDTFRFELEESTSRVVEDSGVEREDEFHVAFVGFSYQGPLVVDLRYSYFLNRSNSYGQNLVRHSGSVMVTAPLPLGFFVSGHLELQRTRYDDPVLLDASFRVDEDNRNSFVLSLAYALGESWEIEGRYSLYLQEFGVGSDYQRQTFMLAGAYLFE